MTVAQNKDEPKSFSHLTSNLKEHGSKPLKNYTQEYPQGRLKAVRNLLHASQSRPEGFNNEEAFLTACSLIGDSLVEIRRIGCEIIGMLADVSISLLLQTLEKETLAFDATTASSFTAGNTDFLSNGALVRALEDEFEAVRLEAITSICKISLASRKFRDCSLDLLIDMLNDEIDSVRYFALDRLVYLAQWSHGQKKPLLVDSSAIRTLLFALSDHSATVRRLVLELLGLVSFYDPAEVVAVISATDSCVQSATTSVMLLMLRLGKSCGLLSPAIAERVFSGRRVNSGDLKDLAACSRLVFALAALPTESFDSLLFPNGPATRAFLYGSFSEIFSPDQSQVREMLYFQLERLGSSVGNVKLIEQNLRNGLQAAAGWKERHANAISWMSLLSELLLEQDAEQARLRIEMLQLLFTTSTSLPQLAKVHECLRESCTRNSFSASNLKLLLEKLPRDFLESLLQLQISLLPVRLNHPEHPIDCYYDVPISVTIEVLIGEFPNWKEELLGSIRIGCQVDHIAWRQDVSFYEIQPFRSSNHFRVAITHMISSDLHITPHPSAPVTLRLRPWWINEREGPAAGSAKRGIPFGREIEIHLCIQRICRQ